MVIDCRPVAGAPLRSRCRADPARDGARVARRGRPAARPRRPHRARRLLPAVGRAADGLARALWPAGDPGQRTSPRSFSTSPSGASPIPPSWPFSIRRRPPRSPRRARSSPTSARSTRSGRITADGKALQRACRCRRGSPAWCVDASRAGNGRRAAEIAAVLTERGLGGNDIDLRHRLDGLRRDRSPRAEEARRMARRWAESAAVTLPGARCPRKRRPEQRPERGPGHRPSRGRGRGRILGRCLARPRLSRAVGEESRRRGRRLPARQRSRRHSRPRLAAGPGAVPGCGRDHRQRCPGADHARRRDRPRRDRSGVRRPYRDTRGSVGRPADARAALPALAPPRLHSRSASSRCRSSPTRRPPCVLAKAVVAAGLDRLPWTKALQQWRGRVLFLRAAGGDEWPNLSDTALAGSARRMAGTAPSRQDGALRSSPWPNSRRRSTPCCPTRCAGGSRPRRPPISTRPRDRACLSNTRPRGPKLAIRVQELFGLDRHPTVARGRVPVVIELLSPAHRPVQVTRDLPNFWRGSYAAVRADLRGRYPRHPWPEDPLSAPATRRAKPRGQ